MKPTSGPPTRRFVTLSAVSPEELAAELKEILRRGVHPVQGLFAAAPKLLALDAVRAEATGDAPHDRALGLVRLLQAVVGEREDADAVAASLGLERDARRSTLLQRRERSARLLNPDAAEVWDRKPRSAEQIADSFRRTTEPRIVLELAEAIYEREAQHIRPGDAKALVAPGGPPPASAETSEGAVPAPARREAPNPPWRRRVRVVVPLAALSLLIGGLVVSARTGDGPVAESPKAVLYRFHNGERCRLSNASYESYLERAGYRLDRAIAEVAVSGADGAERLLSYTIAPEPNVRYYTYAREGDTRHLERLRAQGWRPSGGEAQPNDAGWIYPSKRRGTVPLWRGRKGWAHCVSIDKQELERLGYRDLEMAGYVWPPPRQDPR